MKIGIITFHFPHNYGAMLQAYALQEYIKSMGNEVYIIDYAPKYHTKKFRKYPFLSYSLRLSFADNIKNCIAHLLNCRIIACRYRNFETFKKKHLNLYRYKTGDDLSDFDLVILGSDQIWNQELTNNRFDDMYYGSCINTKVLSYAASSRYRELTAYQQQEFQKRLRNLSFIGVREVSLKQLLQPLTEKEIYVNVDPTLLAEKRIYDSLELKQPSQEKYVLIYEIQPHDYVVTMAEKYARERGYKLICLAGYVSYPANSRTDYCASPELFLAYIKYAECVFTTSFHGTVFSLIFEKDFYCIRQNNNSDLRMESMLSQLGIINRFVNQDDSLSDSSIDYKIISNNLLKLRSDSVSYLNLGINKNARK